MIRVVLHHDRTGFREDVPSAAIGELIRDPANVVWLDVQDPTDADLDMLRREFGFHELALEDVTRRHQRPKVDEYEGYYFVVFYAVEPGPSRRLQLREVDLFVGSNYLVSVHHGPVADLVEASARWRAHRQQLESGVALLLYAVLDSIVDSYFPVVDEVAERVDDLEDRLFARPDRGILQGIFRLRRDLLALRRVLGPERDVLNHILRHDEPLVGRPVLPYIQDVYDHVLRIVDSVDLYRDLLASTLEAYLAAISNSLNLVMKRLTALTVILMAPTLIAGIYGMNFHLTPSPDWEPGFWVVVGAMGLSVLGLAVMFRRGGWL